MIAQLMQVLPMATIVIGAFVLMLLSRSHNIKLARLNLIAVFFLMLSFSIELTQFGSGKVNYAFPEIFSTLYILDDFSILFDLMFTLGATLTLLINTRYFESRSYYNGEYFALILFSVFGMMTLAHANELITAFIALEIASLSIYALVGYHKNNHVSSEAMMKYLVLGSMSGAFFILGTALIYGATGTTQLDLLAHYMQGHNREELLLVAVGGSFIMVTMLFKIGAVPFHAWVVDVYHGSPYPVTMFMASTFKIAIFAIVLRLYISNFVSIGAIWTEMIQIVTVLTLIGGSWMAITQSTVKRMLAGSSIVHGGYMLMAISSIGLGSQSAAPAVMFYLIAYFLSSVGAFGILSYIASESNRQMTFEDFKGFAERRPYLSGMMTLFMLSLSGFPSTIGFLGKFYLFSATIESGQIFLTGVGILTAFISVYYYFKLVAMMYFYPAAEKQEKLHISFSSILIFLMALLVVWGGIGTSLIPFVPGIDSFVDVAKQAISSLPRGA